MIKMFFFLKKFRCMEAFLIIIILGISSAHAMSKAIIYRDDVNGFEITGFANWEKDSEKPYALLLKRKSEKGNEGLAAYSVTVGIASGSLSEFSKFLIAEPNKYEAQIRTRFPDAHLISTLETVIGGFPALKVVTRYSQSNLDVKIQIEATQYLVVRGSRSYMIQLETQFPVSELINKEFKRMQSTFNFR